MKNRKYRWLLYNLLAMVSGITAYHFYSEGKWFNAFVFSGLAIAFIALMYSSVHAQAFKTEK